MKVSNIQLFLLLILVTAPTGLSFIAAPSNTASTWCTRSSSSSITMKYEYRTKDTHIKLNASNSNEEITQSDLLPPIPVTGVTLKMAFDKNYAVADASEFKSTRFTSPPSLDLVHQLRRNSDCVLVGKGTVIRDDCTLTVRRVALFPNKRQPARVILDSNLEILQARPASEKKLFALLQDGFDAILYHSCPLLGSHQEAMAFNPHLTLVQLRKGDGTHMSPTDIVQDLQSREIHHIMVEGGPATAIPFLQENVVDRAIIIRAPVTFIEPVASNMNNDMLKDAGLVLLEKRSVGDDVVEYWVREGEDWPTVSVADWPN
mmetsp:Transcript_2271/g.3470  ORF Transcript_2271/g.3470 Transcript_2271/m.3470 type:complete len:317 (+) Transcript_2271:101-1051(+)